MEEWIAELGDWAVFDEEKYLWFRRWGVKKNNAFYVHSTFMTMKNLRADAFSYAHTCHNKLIKILDFELPLKPTTTTTPTTRPWKLIRILAFFSISV